MLFELSGFVWLAEYLQRQLDVRSTYLRSFLHVKLYFGKLFVGFRQSRRDVYRLHGRQHGPSGARCFLLHSSTESRRPDCPKSNRKIVYTEID